MKLKPYPKYKDSGVPWLGEIPTHWNVRKLRSLLKPINEKNQSHLPLLSVVREKGIIKRDISSKEENHNFIPEDLNNYKVVRSGQFAMNKMKAWQGSYGISKYEGVVSPAYFVFDLKDVDADFFHLAVRSQAYVSFFGQASDGVRVGQWDLSQVRMKEIPFAIPDEDEQSKIIQFLNYKTIQINKFIRNKRSLIKLLNEQKQVIINQAVTRGIDPSISLSPSGIFYVGDIPAKWGVRRGKYLFKEVDERSETGGEELLSVSHITGITPRSQKNIYMFQASSYAGSKLCYPGDIAVNTMWAWMAALGVSSYFGIVSPSYHTYRQKDMYFLSQYLDLLLRTHQYRSLYLIDSQGITSSRSRLYPENFLNIKFPVPPLDDQAQILNLITDRTQSIDTVIIRTQREIELMLEYRTRLISDVVTGKIDVRDIEIPALPDEDIVVELDDEELLAAAEAELEAVEEADE